jgi:nitrate reductase gamma subunit
MDLLGFARGPALGVALVVFCVGVAWRLTALVLLRHRPNFNAPRNPWSRAILRGLVTVGSRSWPHPEFVPRTGAGEALGYSYHIGLFIVILFSAPHIAFFHSLFGVSWPALPNSVITIVSVLTFTLLLAVLFRRLTHRVLRLLSNFDDYFSWFITTLVIVTGLMATAHLGGPYQVVLGLHILSFDALVIWFPFGKLMHAFYLIPSRALNGTLLARKGAPS